MQISPISFFQGLMPLQFLPVLSCLQAAIFIFCAEFIIFSVWELTHKIYFTIAGCRIPTALLLPGNAAHRASHKFTSFRSQKTSLPWLQINILGEERMQLVLWSYSINVSHDVEILEMTILKFERFTEWGYCWWNSSNHSLLFTVMNIELQDV